MPKTLAMMKFFAERDMVTEYQKFLRHKNRIPKPGGRLSGARKLYDTFWLRRHSDNWLYSMKMLIYCDALEYGFDPAGSYAIAERIHEAMMKV